MAHARDVAAHVRISVRADRRADVDAHDGGERRARAATACDHRLHAHHRPASVGPRAPRRALPVHARGVGGMPVHQATGNRTQGGSVMPYDFNGGGGRDRITQALMNIQNPPPQSQMPQAPPMMSQQGAPQPAMSSIPAGAAPQAASGAPGAPAMPGAMPNMVPSAVPGAMSSVMPPATMGGAGPMRMPGQPMAGQQY